MSDYSALSTARSLAIHASGNSLSDVSFLQENEEIIITACYRLVDYANCFHKTKKIKLDFYSASVDVDINLSNYSKVEEFKLEGDDILLTHGLARGIIPPTLKQLQLKGVGEFTDLIGFGHLNKVSLIECLDVSSLSGLERVASVSLVRMPLKSLEGLGENKDVFIEFLDEVTDFSPLKYVKRVTVRRCRGFTDASHLDHVSHVSIKDCNQLVDVSALRNAESIELDSCRLVKTVEALKDVQRLSVRLCPY